jgi:putative transferase (TIGR04331 family)
MTRPLIISGSPTEAPDAALYTRAVVLGPWCFAYRDDIRFDDQRNYELAPAPWNWNGLDEARRSTDELADRICDAFCKSLGETNSAAAAQVDRLVVQRHFKGWFLLWIGVCLERFHRLDNLRKTYPDEVFRVRVLEDTPYVEEDLVTYFSKQVGQEYNLLLFSDLIRAMGHRWPHFQTELIQSEWKATAVEVDPQAARAPVRGEAGESLTVQEPTRLQSFKRRVRALTPAFQFSVRSDIHGRSLRFFEKLRLQWKLAPGHLLHPFLSLELKDLGVEGSDWSRWTDHFSPRNDFEGILTKLLVKYMPPAYARLYTPRASRRKLRRVVMIGGDNYSPGGNDLCSAIRRAGGSVYTYQHGGGYGQYQAFANEDVERVQVNAFLSWGWTDDRGPCIAMPSPYLSELKEHAEREDILILAGTMLPPVVYKLQTSLSPEHLLPYIEDKKNFIQALAATPAEKLEYRLAPLDFGIQERQQIEEILPADRISVSGKLTDRLGVCRLAVFDHMATSFLESLAMNTPTVLFWRPEFFGVNEKTAADLEELGKTGIYFKDAAQAARQVNRIWSDVEGWWRSSEVQTARRNFCARYALRDRNWLATWEQNLKKAERARRIREVGAK